MGASGSGKSTLMHIIGCLDVATSGRYLLDGIDVGDLRRVAARRSSATGRSGSCSRPSTCSRGSAPFRTSSFRSRMPASVATERRRRALAALEVVGLREVADRTRGPSPEAQQQRAAIARALVTSPSLLLADEPTGNLDSQATSELLAVLDRSHARGGTIVVVTHEHEVAEHARRVVTIRDGAVVNDRARESPARDRRSRSRGRSHEPLGDPALRRRRDRDEPASIRAHDPRDPHRRGCGDPPRRRRQRLGRSRSRPTSSGSGTNTLTIFSGRFGPEAARGSGLLSQNQDLTVQVAAAIAKSDGAPHVKSVSPR